MIGFFGGTFDPIHLGHLHAARTAAAALGCASMHVVLAARPGHRDAPVASIEHRWAMLTLAVDGDPVCVADDREIRRPELSYTVDTLELLRAELGPETSIVWCIGADQYRELLTWRRPERIVELAHLAVLRRPGGEATPGPMSAALEGFVRGRLTDDPVTLHAGAGRIYLLPSPMLDISATTVRRLIARGDDPSQLLPARVSTYIKQHRLYGGSGYPEGQVLPTTP